MSRQETTADPSDRSDPGTMTSIVQDRYGTEPETVLRLGSAPVPVPGAGEVLVRVAGASVDRGTWHLMAGLPYPVRLAGVGARRPAFGNPGLNLAGVVETVGADVTAFRVGDAVFGVGRATLAEFAVAPAGRLALKPPSLTDPAAAAIPVSGVTALQAVRDHGKVRSGDRVLVYGASGGVGSFAVQLAVNAGASVTAVCSAAKGAHVAALGADVVLPYEDGEPEGPFDVILDTGGNRPLRVLRRLLTADGRLVLVGGENGGRWLGGADRQLRARAVSPFVGQSLSTYLASVNSKDLAELAAVVDSGALIPLIDRVYPLARAAEAVRRLIDGRAVGKISITV